MLEKIDLKKKCQGKEYKARLEEESAGGLTLLFNIISQKSFI